MFLLGGSLDFSRFERSSVAGTMGTLAVCASVQLFPRVQWLLTSVYILIDMGQSHDGLFC